MIPDFYVNHEYNKENQIKEIHYVNLKSLYVPQKTKETIKIEGSDEEIAEQIINVLKNELGLI